MEQDSETSRLDQVLQSLRAAQTTPQSSSARALTDVLVTLAEEVAALREQLQAHAAAPATLGETQALQERLAALTSELQGLRAEVARMSSKTTPSRQYATPSLIDALLTPELEDLAPPLPRKEAIRRLSLGRRSRKGDPPTGQERPLVREESSRRERLLVTLVPILAVIVLLVLFAVGASRLLMR